MEVVTRTSRLLRIVAQLRAFLVAEDRLDGIVDVDDILVRQQPVEDIFLVSREPRVQFAPVGRFERAPHAVLADDPSEAEQRRKHRVVSQSVDMHVPCEAADDREHGRADDVADIGSVRARVMKRGVFDEPVEQPTCLQIGYEVRESAPLRDLGFLIPADIELAPECRDVDSLCRRGSLKKCILLHVTTFRLRLAFFVHN